MKVKTIETKLTGIRALTDGQLKELRELFKDPRMKLLINLLKDKKDQRGKDFIDISNSVDANQLPYEIQFFRGFILGLDYLLDIKDQVEEEIARRKEDLKKK